MVARERLPNPRLRATLTTRSNYRSSYERKRRSRVRVRVERSGEDGWRARDTILRRSPRLPNRACHSLARAGPASVAQRSGGRPRAPGAAERAEPRDLKGQHARQAAPMPSPTRSMTENAVTIAAAVIVEC